MNPRENNVNTASLGFVYFNTNNKNANTSDFMAFNNSAAYSPPQGNRFSPVHYSSPTKFQKSPRNFYGRQSGGRNSFRYHNNPDTNNSFNSPNYNNSRNKSGSQYLRNKNNSTGGKSNVSKYYDPTCLGNPWAELEDNLKRTQATDIKVDSPVTKKDITDIEESSSCSDGEQESELETKTSSSEIEEGTT